MIFSVYVLREDPDYAVFDFQLGSSNHIVGQRHEYDCAGVFEVKDDRARTYFIDARGVLAVFDEWKLGAQDILCGSFTDRDTGNAAPITRLWPQTNGGTA